MKDTLQTNLADYPNRNPLTKVGLLSIWMKLGSNRLYLQMQGTSPDICSGEQYSLSFCSPSFPKEMNAVLMHNIWVNWALYIKASINISQNRITEFKTTLENGKLKTLEKVKIFMHLRVKSWEQFKEYSSSDKETMLLFLLNLQTKILNRIFSKFFYSIPNSDRYLFNLN